MPRAAPRNQKKQVVQLPSEERQCTATRADGERCKGQRFGERPVCNRHDEENKRVSSARRESAQEWRDRINESLQESYDTTTAEGIVKYIDRLKDGVLTGGVDTKEATAIKGLLEVQLQALKHRDATQDNNRSIIEMLGGNTTNINIQMTREERKMYLQAGSIYKMGQVLQALDKEGRITRGGDEKLIELNPIGVDELPELPDDDDDFEELFKEAMPHDMQKVDEPHPLLDGVLISMRKCTMCGLKVRLNAKVEDDICPGAIEDVVQSPEIQRIPNTLHGPGETEGSLGAEEGGYSTPAPDDTDGDG